MKPMFFNREHTRTPFVQLDTKKCKACWKCVGNCPGEVIDKVDLPWHKHALIAEPGACTGCLSCIDICPFGAYSIADVAKQEKATHRQHTFTNFVVNNLLLVSGLVMIFSGLVMQLAFHMGEHDARTHEDPGDFVRYEQARHIDASKTVCGFSYAAWSTIHKSIVVFFSLLVIYHVCVHWKWYKGVVAKHLMGKNMHVIVLSVLFLLVAITGFVPWFVDLSGGKSLVRLLFIEIHDKLTFVLIVFLVLHLVKRARWFAATYEKLEK